MAAKLTIRKGIQTKTITQYAWDLMGENKNGWELAESSEQVVTNETEAPSNSKVIDTGIVTNESEESGSQVVTNENEPSESTNVVVSDDRTQFIQVATEAKLKSGMIKDFLDINGIEYKQKDKPEVLIEKLADFFQNDIEKFKTEFGV